MRFRPLVGSLAFVVFFAGCGGAPTTAPTKAPSAAGPVAPASPAPAQASDAATANAKESREPEAAARPVAAESSLPTTRVLDSGKAPLRALRYAFAQKPEWLEMDLKMSMSMGMGAQPGPLVRVPTVRMWTRIDPKELTPEGDLRCAFITERVQVLDDVKVAPAMRANLEKEMAGLVGLEGSSRISTRGVASEVEFSLPAAASDSVRKSMESMRDAIRQMYVPLPEEAVGVGARWQVTSRMPISGALMDVAMTYSLKELRTTGMRADVDVTMSAPARQAMTLPGLPPGATAVLDSVSGQGAGKVSPSFTRLAGEGTMHVVVDSAIEVSAKAEHVRMVVHAETDVTSRPSKAPASSKTK
jgi:hypothetical protein